MNEPDPGRLPSTAAAADRPTTAAADRRRPLGPPAGPGRARLLTSVPIPAVAPLVEEPVGTELPGALEPRRPPFSTRDAAAGHPHRLTLPRT